MGCGNNNAQQTYQTTNGQPPMSMASGGTNVISSPPMATQPMAPQQMAQQAASMPTAQVRPMNPDGTPITDGMVNGKYNPQWDDTINQMAGRMQALQNSGAFLTPYQKAQQQHPFIMGLANGMQTFGQGLTHQPFATSNQDNQTALQNTQAQNEASLMSPANMMNMMFMKQMMGSGAPGTGSAPKATMPNPDVMANLAKNAPKGATHFSPTVGYTDDQGNMVK